MAAAEANDSAVLGCLVINEYIGVQWYMQSV